MIVDYLAPQGTTKHLRPMELWIDFANRRAIDLDGKHGNFTLTTMNDVANVVARAIEYEGEWPVIGGIHGLNSTTPKLIEICSKIQGTELISLNLTITLKEAMADFGIIRWEAIRHHSTKRRRRSRRHVQDIVESAVQAPKSYSRADRALLQSDSPWLPPQFSLWLLGCV